MKKSVVHLLLVLTFIAFTICQKSQEPKTYLFPICVDGEYGYMNQKGETVIELQFSKTYRFVEGLARVLVDDKFGYIDTAGEFVIKPRFDKAGDFHDGLALVNIGFDKYNQRTKSGKFGFIDTRGEVVIAMQYDAVGDFSEGRATVRMKDKKGFIDANGNFYPIDTSFDWVGRHKCGLAWVFDPYTKESGYLNKFGEMVIDLDHGMGSEFSEKLAPAQTSDSILGYKWGFIDTTGKFVIEPQFDYAESFSEGLAPVEINDKYGFVNGRGQLVIDCRFDNVYGFSEGLAPVAFGGKRTTGNIYSSSKWGYIDKTGNFKIMPRFNERPDMQFANGLACVETDKEWGYINKRGQWIWKGRLRFDE